jgi:signal transduction histidine kinase
MTAVALLALLLFALPLAVAIEHRQRDQDRRELIQLAALAANRATVTGLGVLPRPAGQEPEQQIGLYDRGGTKVDGAGPPRLEAEVHRVLDDRIVDSQVGGALITAVPLLGSDGRLAGAVRASEPLEEGRARVRSAWVRLGLLAVLADAAALAVALALARRLTRPLADLTAVATRIGDGDFTTTVPRTGLPEVDRVGAALAGTAARLSEVIAREQAFSADASHQLRSPLAALRVTIESELAHPRVDPTVVLDEALTEIDRLEQTIADLLALARERSPERAPIDLTATLDRLGERWAAPIAREGRQLLVTCGSGGLEVRTSAPAVAHVLDVLVDNARVHGDGPIEVTSRAHHGAVSITVTDHGPGVRDTEHLFVRAAAADGNGIGLALARRLAEAEGGRLVLKRNRPVTEFELTLPAGKVG